MDPTPQRWGQVSPWLRPLPSQPSQPRCPRRGTQGLAVASLSLVTKPTAASAWQSAKGLPGDPGRRGAGAARSGGRGERAPARTRCGTRFPGNPWAHTGRTANAPPAEPPTPHTVSPSVSFKNGPPRGSLYENDCHARSPEHPRDTHGKWPRCGLERRGPADPQRSPGKGTRCSGRGPTRPAGTPTCTGGPRLRWSLRGQGARTQGGTGLGARAAQRPPICPEWQRSAQERNPTASPSNSEQGPPTTEHPGGPAHKGQQAMRHPRRETRGPFPKPTAPPPTLGPQHWSVCPHALVQAGARGREGLPMSTTGVLASWEVLGRIRP